MDGALRHGRRLQALGAKPSAIAGRGPGRAALRHEPLAAAVAVPRLPGRAQQAWRSGPTLMLSSVHAIFNHPGVRAVWQKSRVLAALAVAAAILWFMDPRWLLAGFIVSMIGEAIQLWCFASLNKDTDLACNGPYTVVRNPMYLGRFFILLGMVMLPGNAWIILAYTLLYYFYMVNRVKREEERLRAALGASYVDYCGKVNRFLPTDRKSVV